jgi:hypothetical protein
MRGLGVVMLRPRVGFGVVLFVCNKQPIYTSHDTLLAQYGPIAQRIAREHTRFKAMP